MKMITGLGNPGNAYWDTRHNIGFDIADALIERYGHGERSNSGSYELEECRFKGQSFVVMKPMTFMNRSGSAVTKALAHSKVALDDGTREFPRLRFGIGNDYPRGMQIEYVLSRFSSSEKEIVDETLELAVEALTTFIRSDLTTAMNHFNKKTIQPKTQP
jgi:PTH1 family peptidyl-tRNA hydrolase